MEELRCDSAQRRSYGQTVSGRKSRDRTGIDNGMKEPHIKGEVAPLWPRAEA